MNGFAAWIICQARLAFFKGYQVPPATIFRFPSIHQRKQNRSQNAGEGILSPQHLEGHFYRIVGGVFFAPPLKAGKLNWYQGRAEAIM